MKKIVFASSVLLLTLTPSVYAEEDGERAYENPGLSAYLAEKAELPPPPKLEFPFPEGVYVSGTVGTSRINRLRVTDQFGTQLERVNQANQKNSVAQGGVAIGYLFKEAGWFNQLEVQYMGRNGIKYAFAKPRNCVFAGGNCELNTSVKTQTVMAKLYSTLNIGHSLFPYVFAGAGGYSNKAPASLLFTLPGQAPQFITLSNATNFNPAIVNATTTTTTTNNGNFLITEFGQPFVINNTTNVFTTGTQKVKRHRTGASGSGGVGVRFRVSPHIMLDVNYEYTYLGKVQNWNLFIPPTTLPLASFNGDKISGNSVNFSVLIQPWGFASEAD